MSAYAALVSLRQILLSIIYPQPQIIQNRAQLQILLEEAGLLLKFLDVSSTYKESQISALETKMRDAAHKAEDLIEYGILDSDSRTLHDVMKLSCLYFLTAYVFVSLSQRIHLSYAEMEPVWIQFFLVEVVFCTMNAALLYRNIRMLYVFPALHDSQELRRVLHDFNIIMKDVIQIKEARGEPGMSAHAALISLQQILDSVLDSGGRRMSLNRAHLKYLDEMVSFLLDFLGNVSIYMSVQKSELQKLDASIGDAAYKAKKSLIEFQLPGKFSLDFDWRPISTLMNVWLVFSHAFAIMLIRLFNYLITYGGFPQEMIPVCFAILGQLCLTFASYMGSVVVVLLVLAAQYNSDAPEKQELPQVVDDFSIIVREVNKIKDAYGDPSDLSALAVSSRQGLGGTGKDVVVGLDSDSIQIKARLLQHSPKRQLASIVGMGGIGKTTLARQVYKDSDILNHFDVRGWVTVSQEYSLRHVLLCLLDSAQMLTEEKRQDNDDNLALYLHKYLMCRRYLIVIDDVWDTEIWDFLSRFFPENCNGSRILLTSRLPNVASYPDSGSPLHHMRCLNNNDSWELLCRKVFGAEVCPLELESTAREIAQNCGGLPLAIVVIGGLLYKDIQIQVWRDVAEKLKQSELQDIKEQCLEILGLSYNHLPHHLRPCFLYMGVFLADCEIPISRLINLWVAEGFLEPCRSKTLEEVAERYLKELIDRNLILVRKRSCNGKMRTCSIHDLLRDVCVQNARKENFLHVVDSGGYVTTPDDSPRRLSIHPDALQANARHDLMTSYDHVRSVLCIATQPIEKPLMFYLGFLYLRVLDVLELHFGEFPDQILQLVRLRYLAFHCDGPLPHFISKLQNLETIVHHFSFRKYLSLPTAIWSMPNLRHIYVKPGCYLWNSLRYSFSSGVYFLLDLQTLVGVKNFEWTKDIIERIPNLKKLGISYHVSSCVDWSTYQLETLVYLCQLESLKIIIKYYDDVGSAISHDLPKLAFPQKLRKLSLSGCRIPWASMTAIGALPNLEALKLRRGAFCGPSWETVEGEFPRLMFLLLEEISFTRWETDDAAHFPRLQCLVISWCGMLQKIPSAIGDIPTLEMICLVGCHPSANDSAKQIQEEQESMGNVDLKVCISL